MPWMESLSLMTLLAVGWFWFDGFQAREAGMRHARAACESENLLLLDDTVALASLRLRRDEEGKLRWRRIYHFEYSDTGDNRHHGSVTLLGSELVMLHLSHVRQAGLHCLSSLGAQANRWSSHWRD